MKCSHKFNKNLILIVISIILIFIILIYIIHNNENDYNEDNEDVFIKNKNGLNVNVENFVIAETHMYMIKYFKRVNKVNTFYHYRDFDIDNAVVRMNLDTLYSIAIIDLTQDNVKITLPEVNDRYMSCCVLDKEHYEVLYTTIGGDYMLPKNKDNYLVCLIRILVKDRTDTDIKLVNNIQDQIHITSKNYSNKLNLPKYDLTSYKHTKSLVSKLFETSPKMDSVGMFGKKNEVNELKHLLGVNIGWGGLSEKQAYYISNYAKNNDGEQEYSLTFRDVPVRAFWSIIIYDKDGFIYPSGKKSLNNFTSKVNTDGSYTINFSNDPNKINQLNIAKGWNYTIRMYEAMPEILNGKWKFPELKKNDIK